MLDHSYPHRVLITIRRRLTCPVRRLPIASNHLASFGLKVFNGRRERSTLIGKSSALAEKRTALWTSIENFETKTGEVVTVTVDRY